MLYVRDEIKRVSQRYGWMEEHPDILTKNLKSVKTPCRKEDFWDAPN
jgi:hypothetical protein